MSHYLMTVACDCKPPTRQNKNLEAGSLCAAVPLLCLSSQGSQGKSLAGQLFDNPCSDFEVSEVKPLSLNLLYGDWYLFATFDGGLPLHDFDCINFVHKRDGLHHFKTTENALNLKTKERSLNQSRLFFTNRNRGRYTYEQGKIAQVTLIVDTDRSTYYIEYVCSNVKNEKSTCYLGIFTKLPIPTDATQEKVNKFLAEHKFNQKPLRYVNQDPEICGY